MEDNITPRACLRYVRRPTSTGMKDRVTLEDGILNHHVFLSYKCLLVILYSEGIKRVIALVKHFNQVFVYHGILDLGLRDGDGQFCQDNDRDKKSR